MKFKCFAVLHLNIILSSQVYYIKKIFSDKVHEIENTR